MPRIHESKHFKETCDMYGKGGGFDERKYYHFKLSPNPTDNPSPEQVHKLAERLAGELFSAHQCVIATHTDTDTVHSHIIVNAVSFATGKKLHLSIGKNGEYAQCKDLADTLGAEMGFSALDWRERTDEKRERLSADEAISMDSKYLSQAERHISKRDINGGASWKDALRQTIYEAKSVCTTRAEFQQYLENNYGVTMPRNTTKTVSFVHPAVGDKFTIRGAKLGADYTPASIDRALYENKERSMINAGLFINEANSTVTAASAAGRVDTAGNAFISQPAIQNGTGERLAPGGVGAVSAEIRGIEDTVQSITGRVNADGRTVDRLAEKGTAGSPAPAKAAGEHERSVQPKPKRRSHSYER